MRSARYLMIAVLLASGLCLFTSQAMAAPGQIWVIDLADTINPGSTEYLLNGLKKAQSADAALVVIRLDTPGGVADSMRTMVQAIMKCTVPVAVYVAPAGARATSAGAFLVLSGGVAAMAPATHLGAASPVAAGGKEIEGTMAKKAKSDLAALIKSLAKRRGVKPELAEKMVTEAESYDAGHARELGLVDLVARDLGSLIKALEGRVVKTGDGDKTISTKGRNIYFHQPGFREKALSALANPNLAYILLMIGMAGLYFELSNPGSILPGVVGGLALILAFFAMSALPVSYAGLALLGLAVVFFIAEIKVPSFGLLSLGGAVALLLGSLMLFEEGSGIERLSWTVLVPTLIGTMAFFGAVAFLAGRAQIGRSATGLEGMVGARGVALDSGRVRVMGEIWQARSDGVLKPGQEIEVIKADGLVIDVKAAGDEQAIVKSHKE